MATRTRIIDALLVTLGLDDTQYREGQRRATKELNTTRKAVSDASTAMAKAINGAARQFAIAFLGFSTGVGLVKLLGNLNETASRFELIARNTGNAARTLKQYANAAEIAGGTTDGFLGTIQKIREEQASFRLRGESAWIPYLNTLKAGGLDWAFKSEIEILTELAAAFERVSNMPGQGRPMAYSLGREMGIDEGTMNLLLKGPAAIKALIDKQEALTRNYDKTAAAARVLTERWKYLKQQGEMLGLTLLTQLQPHLIKLADWLNKMGSEGINSGDWARGIVSGVNAITDAVRELWGFLKDVKDGFDKIADSPIGRWVAKNNAKEDSGIIRLPKSVSELAGMFGIRTPGKTKEQYAAGLAAAERTYGLPEGMLSSLAERRTGWNDAKINGRTEYDPALGKTVRRDAQGLFGTGASTDTMAAGLQSLLASAKRAVLSGNGVNTVLDPGFKQLGLDAFYGFNPLAATQGARPGAGTVLAPDVKPYTQTIDIGQIVIQTQATDANSIAAQAEAAIRRRLEVGLADYGMR